MHDIDTVMMSGKISKVTLDDNLAKGPGLIT